MNRNDLIRRGDLMDVLEDAFGRGEISATVALEIAGVAAVEPTIVTTDYSDEKDGRHWLIHATFDISEGAYEQFLEIELGGEAIR